MSAMPPALGRSRYRWRVAGLCAILLGAAVFALAPRRAAPEATYEWNFDDSLRRLQPVAYEVLAHDRKLRAFMLRESKLAFDRGGWPASNDRFWALMSQYVQIYAGDSTTLACNAAWNGITRALLAKPALCHAYLLGDTGDPFVKSLVDSANATCAPTYEEGGRRRASGATPDVMSHDEAVAVYKNSFVAPSPLTAEERKALAAVHPDESAFCRGNLRIAENLAALPADQVARYARLSWSTQTQLAPLSDMLPEEPPPPGLVCARAGTVFTLSMEGGKTGRPITWQSVGQKGWDCPLESSASGARGLWGEPRENPIRLLWPLKIGNTAEYVDGDTTHMLRVVDEQSYWLAIGRTHGFAIDESVSVGGQMRYVVTHYWSPELGFKIGQRLVVKAGERPEEIAPDWQVIGVTGG